MRRIVFAGAIILALASQAGCGIEGLHAAKPMTRVKAGPYFTLENSKDVSVQLKRGGYDPYSNAVVLEDLKLTDNASSVREANVGQMEGMALQARANWEGATSFLAEASSFIREALPIFGAKAAWTIGSFFGTAMLTLLGLIIGLPLLTVLVMVVVVTAVVIIRKLWSFMQGQR